MDSPLGQFRDHFKACEACSYAGDGVSLCELGNRLLEAFRLNLRARLSAIGLASQQARTASN